METKHDKSYRKSSQDHWQRHYKVKERSEKMKELVRCAKMHKYRSCSTVFVLLSEKLYFLQDLKQIEEVNELNDKDLKANFCVMNGL